MKKQIFSLLLSTAIFTTNPLFAMETDGELKETKSIPHACPTCTQIVEYPVSDLEAVTGKGNFLALPNDCTIYTISQLDLKDVHAVSSTSKVMYNFSQHSSIWNYLSYKEKENFIFSSILKCPKIIFKTAYLEYPNLFKDETPEVKVPLSWLLSRKDIGLKHDVRFSSPSDLFSKAYNLFYLSCFEIKKDSFVLFSAREKDLSILENLDSKDQITFSWIPNGNCPWDKFLFRSKGSIFKNDIQIDIENCFCIQKTSQYFR